LPFSIFNVDIVPLSAEDYQYIEAKRMTLQVYINHSLIDKQCWTNGRRAGAYNWIIGRKQGSIWVKKLYMDLYQEWEVGSDIKKGKKKETNWINWISVPMGCTIIHDLEKPPRRDTSQILRTNSQLNSN